MALRKQNSASARVAKGERKREQREEERTRERNREHTERQREGEEERERGREREPGAIIPGEVLSMIAVRRFLNDTH